MLLNNSCLIIIIGNYICVQSFLVSSIFKKNLEIPQGFDLLMEFIIYFGTVY